MRGSSRILGQQIKCLNCASVFTSPEIALPEPTVVSGSQYVEPPPVVLPRPPEVPKFGIDPAKPSQPVVSPGKTRRNGPVRWFLLVAATTWLVGLPVAFFVCGGIAGVGQEYTLHPDDISKRRMEYAFIGQVLWSAVAAGFTFIGAVAVYAFSQSRKEA